MLKPAGNPYTGTSTIESSVTLTVEPGVKFSKLALTVKGTLNAEGTGSEPIVVTESAGNYTPLAFESGSSASVLNHVEITKSGSETYVKSPIKISKSSPTIKNSTLNNDGFYAIYIPEGGSPEIANNTILNSGGYGGTYKRAAIRYDAEKGVNGSVNIHGNYIEKCGGGIEVSVAGSSTTSTSLSGNTVVQSESNALLYSGPSIPDDITENTLSGNTTNYIQVGGTIAHSVGWHSTGAKLRVSGGMTVATGATLTMSAAVYVINPNIVVNGTLVAEGTSEEPVVFTESAEKGKGLAFEPSSGASILDHVEISSVGSETYVTPPIAIKESSPKVLNSTLRNDSFNAIAVYEGGSPEIANNKFIKTGNGGTYKRGAIYYNAAGKANTGNVNIHGNYVEKCGGGIEVSVNTSSSVTASTLSGNTVIESESTGITYSGPEVPGDVTENTLTGNVQNYIQAGGTVAHSSTWKNGGSKVQLTGITIAPEVTLKVSPGVYLGNPNIAIKGTLLAEGTSKEPIIFNEATSKGKALTFEPGSGGSVLDYVEVSHAGSETYVTPAIAIKKSSPTITHSVIHNVSFYGIEVYEGGSPEIANNVILEAGNGGTYKRAAIYYGAEKENTGNVDIHNNYVEKCGGGIEVSAANSSVIASTLSGNTVIETEGIGLSYSGPEVPGDITENTLIGNKTNYIQIGGTVAHSSTWKDGGSRVLITEVTIAPEVTLHISPGVYLGNPAMIVKGTLLAEGTSEKPVVFSGIKETSAGEWKSIVFEAGSGSSVLDHVEVAYGGKGTGVGMIEAKGSHPTITNSTIRKSGNYGIKVTESGSPRIEWDRFRSNVNGIVYSGTGNLSAHNNDWNCASGPKPAGCGDSVTSNVSWKPAVELPELAGHCRGKESQCGEGADPVSLATGQLDYSHQDLLLTNKSEAPLEFTRVYNSGSTSDTGLGPGWSQTGLASAMELASGEVLVVRQDGRQDLFEKTESGYKAPSGVTDTLAKVEGTFQVTTLQGTVYRFESSGRIASVTDSHGLKTTYAYNAEGRLTTITDPSAQTLAFTYNGTNHITVVKDSTGREVKFGYSAAGDLETVTDALGGVTKYAYDAQHRLTSITDPRKNVILKNIYDGQGRTVEQRDGLEHLWKLEYGSGETVVTEPEGGKLKYGFDGQNRVVSETDQLGNKTTIAYDEAGNAHEVVKSGGAKWIFGHDAAGNLTSVHDPEGGERKYEYDAQNRLTGFTDARGSAWSYEWSKASDLTKIVDPEKGETTLAYNESGQLLTSTDPDKHKTEFSYDSRGNELSTTDPLGHKTSFEYDSRSYLTSKTPPGLKAEKFERDALGDMLVRTTPEGNKTKYAYDANGLPTQITDPGENVWKIERNAMERPTAYIDPLEQQIKTTYNGNLKPTKVINRRGKEMAYAYNAANQLIEVAQPEGGDWHFGYDSRGNRSSVIDPREHETTYEYDLLDRMTEANEPLGTSTEYGYDANGDLTSVIDPHGNTTSYAYDKLGRLTEVAQPLEQTTTYSYNAAGNPLTRATAAGTLEYAYDAANRLTEASASKAALRSFGYDAANRRTSAVDAQGHKIEIGYNGDGLVTSINDGRGQSLTRAYNSRGELTKQVDGRGTLEYGYDKLGRLTSLTDPQSKALSYGYDPEGDVTEVKRPNGITTTNVYNDAGRLSETTSKEESSAVLEALNYGYDAAGNVTSKLDARLEQETTYGYDALNRLIEFNPPGEGATSYGYDEAGNRTESAGTTYNYNALNQLTSASDGTTYSYDGAGRMTGKENGSEKTSYGWDLFDHLAKVEGPTETVNYGYDSLERLSERKNGGATQVMHYGDLTDLLTYNANGEGKTTTSYVQGAHGLVEQRSGEATSYPLADAHGDITAITGPAGAVESRQSYDPWGVQLSGPSLEMGYLGAQERSADPTIGLIQMGARSYDPALGGFASEDPVVGRMGVGASVNRYLYVWDNPLNYYDLNGRETCVSTPLGDICPVKEAEDIGGGAEQVGNVIGSGAENAWDFTKPGRNWIKNNAQDFWKEFGSPLERFYKFAGENWQTCLQGGSVGAAAGFVIGSPLPGIGNGAGAVIGGVGGCAGLVGAKEGLKSLAQ